MYIGTFTAHQQRNMVRTPHFFWAGDATGLLGVQSVADVVRHGRLRWFGHLKRRSVDDWVSACRKVEVAGVRCQGRKRKTYIYLFKQLVSCHNVNHTKNSYRRIAGADKPRDQPAKCLLNKNVFKLRLNEASVNWLSVIS